MDPNEFDISSFADDFCHTHTRQLKAMGTTSKLPIVPSVDPHERYHLKHLEGVDITTDAVSENGLYANQMLERRVQHPQRSNELMQMMSEMQKELNLLKQRLNGNVENTDQINAIASDPQIASQIESNMLIGPQPVPDLKQLEITAELHECSWTEFMNKFQTATKEYTIEVLIGQPEYMRKRETGAVFNDSLRSVIQQEPDAVTDSASSSPGPEEEYSPLPDRIRINSPEIVSILATIDKNIDPTSTLVLFRPFKLLVSSEDRLRDIVRRLEAEAIRLNQMDDPTNLKATPSNPTMRRNSVDIQLNLRHMQCLMQFIDDYIKPTILRLRSMPPSKVSFRDLWYVFQPGDDIFMPVKDRQHHVALDPSSITPEMFQQRYERMWRVIGVGGGRPNLTLTHTRNGRVKQNVFRVTCYYIDFDGMYFCPIVHTFSIAPFSGEREITALDFYPLKFLEQGEELRSKSQAQGKMVFNALLQSHTHFYYRGPTLVTHPCGCHFDDESLHQEHVDSEVIIDYRTTLLKHPSWRPQSSEWKKPPNYPDELQEKARVFHWNDSTRSKLIRTETDVIHDDSVIDLKEALSFKDNARIFDLIPSGWLSNEKLIPEADVAMLSPRLFAFVLRTRSFAPVWLWGLQKIDAQTEGLNNLQLRDNTFKDTIHALVRTHYLQMNSLRHSEIEYDVVRGKGKGLVFLLHGAPGVGKTFTAESVAAANGRPLFQITCGDLGLTPSDVERALKEIFRYAQLWNCVLLLDECDIFLTQRTKNDLKRNSLVSVFLRVLEWYSGVLFLTTNRVGTLDSAVRSRITWSTYYPPLNMKQTQKIWTANLNLLEKRYPNIEIDRKEIIKFVKDRLNPDDEGGANWNGRQIQNAFKVAVSLADWDTLSEQEQHAADNGVSKHPASRRLKVTASHFETVATAAGAFDDYLNEATGQTEAQRAFNAQERFDNYTMEDDPEPEPEPPGKKRRVSSSASAMQQLQPHNSMKQPYRSTNQTPEQTRSRKSSLLQPGTIPQVKVTGYSRGSSDGKSPIRRTSSNERNTTVKRKRADNERFPPHNNKPVSPTYNGEDESVSDFEDMVDANVSSEAYEDMDEWGEE